MFFNIPGITYANRVARKEYRCAYGRGCVIRPFESYVEMSIAPWTEIADDVDDDGRTLSSPAGEWSHERFHARCQMAAEYGE